MVRNGQAQPRRLTVGAGTITVRAPRVNDQRVLNGTRQKFTSAILPPYLRRSPQVSAVLPLLYLHGLSTGDFREALPVVSSRVHGIVESPNGITFNFTEWFVPKNLQRYTSD